MTINNNLLEDRSIGGKNRDRIEPGMQDITFDMTARFEAMSHVNMFLNQTKTYFSAEFTSTVSIDATYFHKITVEAYNCYFNGTTPNIGSAGEIIKHPLPLRAVYEDASVGSLVIKVQTDAASVGEG